MKVKNTGSRPIDLVGIRINPGEIKDIDTNKFIVLNSELSVEIVKEKSEEKAEPRYEARTKKLK